MKLFCWIGLHWWRDILVDGINMLFPVAPRYHVQECRTCGKARRLGHTLYGSVEYPFANAAEALASVEQDKESRAKEPA